MKRKKDAISLRATLALVVIIFLLGLGGVMWYYALYKVAYTQTFDVEVKVIEEPTKVGLNADATLFFGKVPPGGTSMKRMKLDNEWDIPLKIRVKVEGDAARFIMVGENDFIIPAGSEDKLLYFYAVIPEDADEFRTYTGKATVQYLRP